MTGKSEANEQLVQMLNEPSTADDPYPMWKWLRENEPITRANGLCVATRYNDVVAMYRDGRLSRQAAAVAEVAAHDAEDEDPVLREAQRAWQLMLINQDEPGHMRIRSILNEAFKIDRITAWRPRVQAITDALIEKVRDKDEFDLLRELAYPLPEAVICELMGVPLEDHILWGEWTEAVVSSARFKTAPTPEHAARVRDAIKNFYVYLRDLVEERRNSLSDDLVSLLIRAEADGERLSELELSGTLQMLIQAGHETTANLIGNGMYELLKHPDQYERLRDNPALIASAVEEMLRYASPAHYSLPRIATEEVRIGDTMIPAGCPVMGVLNAANRDASVFDEAEKFDIGRERNKHIAFAAGPHFCLGSMLARQETQVMFEAIVTRLPRLELVETPRIKSTNVRALVSLTVRQVRN